MPCIELLNRLNAVQGHVKSSRQKRKKLLIALNAKKVCQRRYNFKMQAKICKKYRDTKNKQRPLYHMIKAKAMKEDEFERSWQECRRPVKIWNPQLPRLKLPEELDVLLHHGNEISYEGNQKLASIPVHQLLRYEGKPSVSVPQMPLGSQYFTEPTLINKCFKKLHSANLWLYRGARKTEWHYDGHDNFLYMFQGWKVIYLAPFQAIKSRKIYSLFNNHVDKQYTKLFLKEASLFEEHPPIQISRAVLKPGECMFIPRGWWHKVFSEGDPSIALNFWGNSLSDSLGGSYSDKLIMFKELFLQISQRMCQEHVTGFEEMPEEQKQYWRMFQYACIVRTGNI